MKRAIIIGCPGSGKSTFARALQEKTGLPLHHLDAIYWNPDRTTIPKEEFRAKLRALVQEDAWIIDGNYGSTMELRIQHCDTIFFLDYPEETCIAGIAARMGTPRSDMPWVETEPDEEFLTFVRSYREQSRPRVLELLDRYAGREIHIFRDRAEAAEYLK